MPGEIVMQRDPLFERAAVTHAAEAVHHPELVDRIIADADRRTDPGPVSLSSGRDLVLEHLDEVVDGFNYATWELLRLQSLSEDRAERASAITEALKLSVLLYDALRRAAQA
jgi:hypothetical protein